MEAITIPAKGHIASETVVVKEANLFEDGESIINCTECGEFLPRNSSTGVGGQRGAVGFRS